MSSRWLFGSHPLPSVVVWMCLDELHRGGVEVKWCETTQLRLCAVREAGCWCFRPCLSWRLHEEISDNGNRSPSGIIFLLFEIIIWRPETVHLSIWFGMWIFDLLFDWKKKEQCCEQYVIKLTGYLLFIFIVASIFDSIMMFMHCSSQPDSVFEV